MNDSLTKRFFRIASVLAVFALLALPAQAQMADAPLTSDRPGFSTSASTVSQGTFQAEIGYQYEQFTLSAPNISDAEATAHSLGLLLLRFGLTDAIELRANVGSIGLVKTEGTAQSTGGQSVTFESDLESGYNGAAAELKARLFQNATTTLSAFSQTTLPLQTGVIEDIDSDKRSRQTFALLLDGALGQNITLTLNGGASFFWDSGQQEDRATSGIFIPTLSFSINDQAGAYVGYFGEYTKSSNTNFVEGGFTYLVSNDTQVDVNGGFRVDDNEDGFFIGLGLSQRF